MHALVLKRVRAVDRTASRAFALALPIVAGFIAGCATDAPRIGMSDPVVYTTPHISLAQREFARVALADPALKDGRTPQLSPLADLQRAFATRSSVYSAGKLRMDDLLDGRQRAEAFAALTALSVSARVGEGEGVAAPASNAASPAAAADPTKIDASDLAALQKVYSAATVDSPFDQFERARAFYTTYTLACLRFFGTDSRAIDVESVDRIAAFEARYEIASEADRKSENVASARTAMDAARDKLNSFADDEDWKPLPDSPEYKAFESWKKAATDQAAAKKQVTEQESTRDKDKANHETALKQLQSTRDAFQAVKRRLAEAQSEEYRKQLQVEMDSLTKRAASEEQDVKSTLDTLSASQSSLGKKTAEYEKRSRATDTAASAVRAAILSPVDSPVRKGLTKLQDSQKSLQRADGRLILLLLQPHIDPGTKADQSASFSLEITSTPNPQSTGDSDTQSKHEDVRVLYLHPTRTYDLSDQTMLDAEQSAISLAARSMTPDLDVSVDVDRRARREARARYLSRINKTASYAERTADGTMRVGWNFYPSNVVVEPTVWGRYKAKGYLEPGGRDCAVWLLVPPNRSITLKMKSSHGDIDGARHGESDGGTYTVQLPAWTPLEGVTVFGEAPMLQPAGDPAVMVVGPSQLFTSPNPEDQ